MKLRSIQIKNFRSIEDSRIINCKNLMLLIGKNNAGKSNFLKALDLFFNQNKPKFDDFFFGLNQQNIDMEITLTFNNLSSEFRKSLDISEDKNFVFSKKYPLKDDKVLTVQEFINDQPFKDKQKDLGIKTITEFRHIIDNYLPSYYYVSALRDLGDEGKLKQNSLLQKVLEPFFDDPEIAKHLKAINEIFTRKSVNIEKRVNFILKGRIDDFDEIKLHFDAEKVSKVLNPTIMVKNSNFTEFVEAERQGAGTQNFIILALSQYNAFRVDNPKEIIVAFEEPEISLHSKAQRKMLDAIKTIIKTNENQQILVTTHSPIFIDKSIESIYCVLKKEGITSVEAFNKKTLIDDLGLRGSDLFLNDALIFVEGDSDYTCFTKWSEELNIFDDIAVSLVPLGGLYSFKDFKPEDFKNLTNRIYVIIDSDKRSENDDVSWLNQIVSDKIENLSGKIFILEKRNLENYFTVDAVKEAFPNGISKIDNFYFDDNYSDMKPHLTEIIREDNRVYHINRGFFNEDKNRRIRYTCKDAIRIARFMVKRNEIPEEIINIFNKIKEDIKQSFN